MFSSPNILFYLSWFTNFCNVLKILVIKTKIKEPTHISNLWAETIGRRIFLFLNYQDIKTKIAQGRLKLAGPAAPEADRRQGREDAALPGQASVGPSLKLCTAGPVYQRSCRHMCRMRAKCVFTRRCLTSGIHLGRIYTSMPSSVFLTSYFNGINCLIW